jgi:hypothetical protein
MPINIPYQYFTLPHGARGEPILAPVAADLARLKEMEKRAQLAAGYGMSLNAAFNLFTKRHRDALDAYFGVE